MCPWGCLTLDGYAWHNPWPSKQKTRLEKQSVTNIWNGLQRIIARILGRAMTLQRMERHQQVPVKARIPVRGESSKTRTVQGVLGRCQGKWQIWRCYSATVYLIGRLSRFALLQHQSLKITKKDSADTECCTQLDLVGQKLDFNNFNTSTYWGEHKTHLASRDILSGKWRAPNSCFWV